ncbi:hypothetical protein SJI19_02265 [Acerihabitans sp. TG2]|uniref:hypothetical protein n=1 Tax=Acerihabitans sp. TG2 TaxID=3096008 RepID=UPI002B226D96|nr:hypothetical protein [Acerihabitans sp. TG2]MEA9389387.1 hypothetical protein [Acerihabitans sp. TG2]
MFSPLRLSVWLANVISDMSLAMSGLSGKSLSISEKCSARYARLQLLSAILTAELARKCTVCVISKPLFQTDNWVSLEFATIQ